MFGFMAMGGTYDSRCVGREEYEFGFISTAEVCDGEKPYETAIEDTRYVRDQDNSRGKAMCIVEAYDSRDDAEAGHARWVEAMKTPPEKLQDCFNSEVGKMLQEFGGNVSFTFKPEDA